VGAKQEADTQPGCAKLLRIEGEKWRYDAIAQHSTEKRQREDKKGLHRSIQHSKQMAKSQGDNKGEKAKRERRIFPFLLLFGLSLLSQLIADC
jgi:hypothetical protein